MLGGNGNVTVGTPEVDGARVVAEIVEHGRGKKILVFKYKNKTRYRRRQGHRQDYTRIAIKEILSGGKSVEEKPKRSRQSISEPEAEEVKAEVTAVVEVETPKKPARPLKAAAKVETAAEATASVEVKAPKKPAARASKPKAETKAATKPKTAKKAPARAKKTAESSGATTAEGTE
jgi:large subunit ribosomal protein L21